MSTDFTPRFNLSHQDRLIINNISYKRRNRLSNGFVLERVDDPDVVETFTDKELFLASTKPDFRFERDAFAGSKASATAGSVDGLIGWLPEEQQEEVLWRTKFCEEYEKEIQAGNATRSDASYKKWAPIVAQRIHDAELLRAAKRNADGEIIKPKAGERELGCRKPPSARSYRKWRRWFLEGGQRAIALRKRYFRSGNRVTERLGLPERQIMHRFALEYMSETRPTKRDVYRLMRAHIVDEENPKRHAAGEKPLRVPSYERLTAEINSFPAFDVHACRHGLDSARKRFAMVRNGVDVERPLQRVEIDEWRINLQTLCADLGILDKLSDKLKSEIATARPWLCAALDSATSVCVGFKIALTPSSDLAMDTLEMVVTPKAPYALAAGALSRDDYYGSPERIVTDQGAAFLSLRFRRAIIDLEADAEAPPAGLPAGIPALAHEAKPSNPTELEQYLEARLNGGSGLRWLDSLPFYVAWRTCEVIGAVDRNGRDAPIRDLSEEDWRHAGSRGYAIAAGGPDRIRAFLHELWSTSSCARQGAAGPQAWFGQFFKWLYAMKGDLNYGPVQAIVIGFVADTAPVSPDDRLFGKQIVHERRLHSVFTATRASGIHHKRLRRVLRASGVLPPDSDHLSDNLVIFPVSEGEPIIELLQNVITLKQAETYINAGRVHTKLLAEHGFIQPVEGHDRLELGDQRYDRRELDEFTRRLFANAVWVKEPEWPQMTIAAAAKRACCSAMEIVKLILDHQLRWVGSWTATTGYQSILVDVVEIKPLTRGEYGDNLTMGQAADLLRSTDRVVSALVESQVLASESRINPINRCPYIAVPRKSVEGFKVQYASLHELARSRRQHMPILKRELAMRGVEPVWPPKQVGASFYLRSTIPPGI